MISLRNWWILRNCWDLIVDKGNNIRYIEYTRSSPRGYRNFQRGIDFSTNNITIIPPVSYTHLDVYKRQLLYNQSFHFTFIKLDDCFSILISSSYTVYDNILLIFLVVSMIFDFHQSTTSPDRKLLFNHITVAWISVIILLP